MLPDSALEKIEYVCSHNWLQLSSALIMYRVPPDVQLLDFLGPMGMTGTSVDQLHMSLLLTRIATGLTAYFVRDEEGWDFLNGILTICSLHAGYLRHWKVESRGNSRGIRGSWRDWIDRLSNRQETCASQQTGSNVPQPPERVEKSQPGITSPFMS